MDAFVRGATGCCLFIAATLLAVPAAWAASTPTCTDETKFDNSNINGVPTGQAWNGPMKFQDGGEVPGYGRVIYAIGVINTPSSKDDTDILDDSARGFENFLKTAGVKPGALVVLHSPGGSVTAGFQIGLTIRKNSLRTMVGQPQVPDASNKLTALATAAPSKGVCASACSLAFLGGTRRTVTNDSLYGVHAAMIETVPATSSPSQWFYEGQVTASQTSAYLALMGIDPFFLFAADQCAAGANQILFLTAAQLKQFKVTTAFTTLWTLADNAGNIALAGSNPDSSAIPSFADDLILECVGTPRRAVMRINYLPEAYNAGEHSGAARSPPAAFVPLVAGYSLSGFRANTVATNQPTLINVTASEAPLSVVDLHHVSTAISVTSPIAALLDGSDILTFSFKGQQTSIGVVNFDLTDGHQLIGDYIAGCQ